MSQHIYQLHPELSLFPDPDLAIDSPNGLLAYGGDLSVERLVQAYRNGIFPWYSEDEPLLWWSPNPRAILELSTYKPSKSLRKLLKKQVFEVSLNRAFEEVVTACADTPRSYSEEAGTWITEEMLQAYSALHQAGHAHSIEVWQQEQLVGGLYGVCSGGVFCGESMFHSASNASKVAFAYLVNFLKQNQFDFVDCQIQNPHLASLGVVEVERADFLRRLHQSTASAKANIDWSEKTLSYDWK